MTLIEHIKNYFMTCPALEGKRIDIDCLAADPDSISIDSQPSERIVKRYLDGSAVCKYSFTLSSRMYYSSDLKQQAENIDFFEQITEWLMEEALLFRLPELGEKRIARTLSVLGSAYPILVSEELGLARYQIQLELIYLQEV